MANTFSDNPQANHTLAADQPAMLANFRYIVDTLGTQTKSGDHQISIGGIDTNAFEGRHLQVSLKNRSGGAPTVAGLADSVDSLIYSSNGNLFFGSVTGPGAFQLTTYNSGSNFGVLTQNYTPQSGGGPVGVAYSAGWTFLPGGLLMQYGTFTTNSTSSSGQTIKFPITFTSASTIIMSVTAQVSAQTSGYVGVLGSPTTTQFQIVNSITTLQLVSWTAIGK